MAANSSSSETNDEEIFVFVKPVQREDPSYWLWDFSSNIADVSLKTDDGELFKCHRNILALGSPYFRAMFSIGMEESNNDEINISCVPSHIMAFVVDFLYRQCLHVPSSEIFNLLSVADMFQISSLSKEVVKVNKF